MLEIKITVHIWKYRFKENMQINLKYYLIQNLDGWMDHNFKSFFNFDLDMI